MLMRAEKWSRGDKCCFVVWFWGLIGVRIKIWKKLEKVIRKGGVFDMVDMFFSM